jgi:50S ribosomal protein L16 3-hydroxylase
MVAYIENLELRIMKEFEIEEEFILEEGDMLYLPPHVGHYGISLSEDCMTYSFGYRSYQGQELWDSLGDYLSEHEQFKALYEDPNWAHLNNTSELTKPTWQNAQKLLREMVDNEEIIKSWFGCFATQLDKKSEESLPMPLEEDELLDLPDFMQTLKKGTTLERDASCRFAYQKGDAMSLYINGCFWDTQNVSQELIRLIANNRFIAINNITEHLSNIQSQEFVYALWKLQWLQII